MTLASDDIDILKLFCRRANEIKESTIYSMGSTTTLKFSSSPNNNLKLLLDRPNKESLLALVTLLRVFYLEGDSLNFRHIYNIVWCTISKSRDDNCDQIKYLRELSKYYKNTLNKGSINIIINNKKLKPSQIVDIWFNGNIFHNEKEKRERLNRLMKSPIASAIEYEFITTILNLCDIMLSFSSFIKDKILSGIE